MATATTKRRPGRPATVRLVVLSKMLEYEKGRATRSDLGITPGFMQTLVRGGFVKATKDVVRAGRGRPATVYSLTLKGRKVAQRATAAV